MKKHGVLGYPSVAQRRLWSDWADAQADLSLCWVHKWFCWFCCPVAPIVQDGQLHGYYDRSHIKMLMLVRVETHWYLTYHTTDSHAVIADSPLRIMDPTFGGGPMAKWLRPLIFSTLNRSSSHHCGIEPGSGHMWDKPSSACRWSGGFSQGSPFFAPPSEWLHLKWIKYSLRAVIKKKNNFRQTASFGFVWTLWKKHIFVWALSSQILNFAVGK